MGRIAALAHFTKRGFRVPGATGRRVRASSSDRSRHEPASNLSARCPASCGGTALPSRSFAPFVTRRSVVGRCFAFAYRPARARGHLLPKSLPVQTGPACAGFVSSALCYRPRTSPGTVLIDTYASDPRERAGSRGTCPRRDTRRCRPQSTSSGSARGRASHRRSVPPSRLGLVRPRRPVTDVPARQAAPALEPRRPRSRDRMLQETSARVLTDVIGSCPADEARASPRKASRSRPVSCPIRAREGRATVS